MSPEEKLVEAGSIAAQAIEAAHQATSLTEQTIKQASSREADLQKQIDSLTSRLAVAETSLKQAKSAAEVEIVKVAHKNHLSDAASARIVHSLAQRNAIDTDDESLKKAATLVQGLSPDALSLLDRMTGLIPPAASTFGRPVK